MGELDDCKSQFSILLPARIESALVLNYAVLVDNSKPGLIENTIKDVVERTFGASQISGIEARVDRYDDLRDEAFQSRRAAVWLLSTMIAIVLLVSGIGIATICSSEVRGVGKDGVRKS